MKYRGKEIRVGDTVLYSEEGGEWTVDAIYERNEVMQIVGPAPTRKTRAASPDTVSFVRRAPKPPRAPRRPRARRIAEGSESVALNIGGHLGVAVIPDESADGSGGNHE